MDKKVHMCVHVRKLTVLGMSPDFLVPWIQISL